MRTKLISVAIALLTGMSVWADEVQAIDLGLPSGLKWASCNEGANQPEDYGNYYAWGEVIPKDDYSWTTYKYANGNSYTLTKYCNNANYGDNDFTDDKTTLDLEDDAAHVNWDGNWRMPTSAEFGELIDNCAWEWTTQNGVKGYKVTSKTNNNSIFFPAAGARDDTNANGVGWEGAYWSSSIFGDYPGSAWYLSVNSGYKGSLSSNRFRGYSVRPVCPKSSTAIVSIVSTADTTTSQKVLHGGQVYIIRNGKTYSVTGVEVK